MATARTISTHPNRISPRDGEAIDRSKEIRFKFDGREYTAHPGDTIASALAAAGVTVFSRSFKYHRPRGLLCCAGHCPNCLVQVGGEPNVRACRRPVQEGMEVRHQNAWPSLHFDIMALTQLGDAFLPVGFYYKTFIRPRRFWPLYEHVLRRAAGLGEVDQESPHHGFSKQYLHADVAVVGGGPAGMSAALAAAERGARVLLFDDNPALGGHLRYARGSNDLAAKVEAQADIAVYTDTTVLGCYDDHWLSAVRGSRLFKIRAKALVVASGAYEAPLVFDNNDLPGVMLGSAVQRLINLYGVAPGRKALVVTANDDGWGAAADLLSAGAGLAAVVDERPQGASAGPRVNGVAASGVPVYWEHTVASAEGSSAVRGAVITHVAFGLQQKIDCDLIAVSVGWTPASEILREAGGALEYDERRAEILPARLPAGVYAAGRVAGTHGAAAQIAEGRLAGQSAAAFVGLGGAPSEDDQSALAAMKSAEPRRTSPRVLVPGKQKQFICYCEDVTQKDLRMAIEEGYDSIELLKRYSTISMGPCQGKMCSMNTTHLCARQNGWTVRQTGATTARPPAAPVSLGALAGQHMEPVQITPVHHWHLQRGAKMMVAGAWLRPERYGDPAEEVRAVRERVGLIDVSTLGKLRLTGPGVPTVLERIYINQWRSLGLGRVRYGVMCSDEAVVLDDGVTARIGEREWYTTTTTSGSSAIFEWIQWWLQSGWGQGAQVANVSEVYAAFNLAGPQSRAVLQKLTSLDISNETFPYMHVRDAEVAGVPCRLLRIGFTGELSYEIHCPAGYGLQLWQALMEAGREYGLVPFGVEAQRVLRLEKAHIIIGQDTDAVTDPLSAGLGWAVKMDKPDFLGKRMLARISAEGPKQRLTGFKMARPGVVPDEGLQVVGLRPNGRLDTIGHITSCRYSPTLGETIGLCWLPAEVAAQNGAPFKIRMDGRRLEEARVHHGPFYDPDGKRLKM